MTRVRRVLGMMLPALMMLILLSPPGWAAETVTGKIEAVAAEGRAILLEDGTQLIIPSSVRVSREQLKEGATVKVTYEMDGERKVVRSIQVQPTQ